MSNCRQIMMLEWQTLSGRFTKEEISIIEKYKKKHNLSDNQLIRQGVQILVNLIAMEGFLTSPDMEFFRVFMQDFKKILDSPSVQKSLEESVKQATVNYKQEQFDKIEKESNEIFRELDVFDEKRKRGRKPIESKNRGRPKNSDN